MEEIPEFIPAVVRSSINGRKLLFICRTASLLSPPDLNSIKQNFRFCSTFSSIYCILYAGKNPPGVSSLPFETVNVI
jgi:hypothetical protein